MSTWNFPRRGKALTGKLLKELLHSQVSPQEGTQVFHGKNFKLGQDSVQRWDHFYLHILLFSRFIFSVNTLKIWKQKQLMLPLTDAPARSIWLNFNSHNLRLQVWEYNCKLWLPCTYLVLQWTSIYHNLFLPLSCFGVNRINILPVDIWATIGNHGLVLWGQAMSPGWLLEQNQARDIKTKTHKIKNPPKTRQ